MKCQNKGVKPLAALFFYFFRLEWPNRGFLSLTRRTNHPKVLEGCPSHPKNWEERFVRIRGVPGVRPWWIREFDNHTMFPLCWRCPIHGCFTSDCCDLTEAEKLVALRLITTTPYNPHDHDPPHMVLFVLIFILTSEF